MEFFITMLKHNEINKDVIKELLEYGKFKGLAQWRNGGYGRFKYEIIDM